MTKLKLAVVGAGHLGRIHARLLAEMPDVDLVGVADPLASAAQQVAASCHTTAHGDHHALLGQVDAAVIAAPTRCHHAVAIDFLRCGTPLLIEKPLASSLAEADDLVQVAEQHGALVQVGHIERFNPAFIAAASQTPDPLYVEAVRASGFTGRSTDIGVVFDLMIHDIDLVLSLVDSPVKDVRALGLAILGRHEDVAHARLEFENGCVANFSASRVSYSDMPRRQMNLWSSCGFAAIDFGSRSASVVKPNAAVLERRFDYDALSVEEKAGFKDRVFREILSVEPQEVESRNALADELRDFVDCVRTGRVPRVTGRQGRAAVAAADAILKSIADHRWHGREQGPMGPLAAPGPAILRGPHWQTTTTAPTRREAG